MLSSIVRSKAAMKLPKRLKRPLKQLYGQLHLTRSFQQKRGHLDKRFMLIQPLLTGKRGCLLDLGCDEGDITILCAKNNKNLIAIGVERNKKTHHLAQRKIGNQTNVGFILANIDKDFTQKLPCFDVILSLSVHHHFWRQKGQDYAKEMLQLIFAKTNLLIIEMPLRLARYENKMNSIQAPNFINNDVESGVLYLTNWFANTLENADVEFLGLSPCLGEREPERPLFVITRMT